MIQIIHTLYALLFGLAVNDAQAGMFMLGLNTAAPFTVRDALR
jgi:hypothetical protein